MTNEEWKKVEYELSGFFSSVQFEIDEYKVTVVKTFIRKNHLGLAVFIDDKLKGEWLMTDCEIRRRFYRRRISSAFRGKRKFRLQQLEKKLKEDLNSNAKVATWTYYWTSVASMRRHFEKNNKEIKLVKEVFHGLS